MFDEKRITELMNALDISREEAIEVLIRFEFSKGIKDKARKDIKEYYCKYYAKAVRK